jgi:hypothetical protein
MFFGHVESSSNAGWIDALDGRRFQKFEVSKKFCDPNGPGSCWKCRHFQLMGVEKKFVTKIAQHHFLHSISQNLDKQRLKIVVLKNK